MKQVGSLQKLVSFQKTKTSIDANNQLEKSVQKSVEMTKIKKCINTKLHEIG